MPKPVVWLLLISAGWLAGWYSHQHWRTGAEKAVSDASGTFVTPRLTTRAPAAAPVTALPERSDTLAERLASGDFQAAIERFEVLQDEGIEARIEHARQLILSTAESLLTGRRLAQAKQLLQGYLVAAFRDVDARRLLADAYRREDNYRAALDQLFEAIGYVYRPETLAEITTELRAVTAEYADILRRRKDHNSLLDLYHYLTQIEPSHAPHFIGLATAQLALDAEEDARRSLQLVIYDPDVGAKAQAMLAQLQPHEPAPPPSTQDDAPPPAEMDGVALVRRGNHFLVDARIERAQAVRLLIDTGASMTILTPEVLEGHGIRYTKTGRRQTFSTANGLVTAPIYRLKSLALDDWVVSGLEVGVLELGGSPGIDGLLGMDFLRHFQFFIDQNQALLRLSLNSPER